jgi:phage terminase small subunit
MSDRPLTPKQQAFVAAFLECGNATASARIAGYAGGDKKLYSAATRLLRHKGVSKAIKEAYAEMGVDGATVLGALSSIAFGPYDIKERLRALEIMARHQISTKREVQHGKIIHDQRTLTKDEEGNVVEFEPKAEAG